MPVGTPHKVTQETQEIVQRLAKLGINQKLIAKYMGMSHTTLSKHYKDIMSIVRIDNIAQVAETAFNLAVGGKCPNMTMFYLKTQAQWRETDKVEQSNEEPITRIRIETVSGMDIKEED